jgi:hypothetical protein
MWLSGLIDSSILTRRSLRTVFCSKTWKWWQSRFALYQQEAAKCEYPALASKVATSKRTCHREAP